MQKKYLKILTSLTLVLSATAQAQTTTSSTETKRSSFFRIIPVAKPPQNAATTRTVPQTRPQTNWSASVQNTRPMNPMYKAQAPAGTNRAVVTGLPSSAALPSSTRFGALTSAATAPRIANNPVAATPAPQAVPPQDNRINRVYLLTEDKVFFKFNHDTGANEEITVPKGTRMRLQSIIETEASRSRKSYWNFVVVDSALSIQAQPVGAELWTIRKKIPKELAMSTSPNNRAAAPNPAPPTSRTAPANRASTPRPVPTPPSAQIEVDSSVLNTPEIVVTAPSAGKPARANYEAEERLDTVATFSIKPGRVWAPACTNFLDERGNPGPWGRAIMATLDRPEMAMMLDGTKMSDLRSMCPAFLNPNYSLDSKKKFWVFFIASMAMSESSCNRGDTTPGPNGTLAGLLQLHLGRESAYGCPRSTNALNAVANVTCGFTMLKNQVIRYGNIFVQKGKTYWEVLHSGTGGAAKVSNRVAIQRSCQQGVRAMPRR